MKKKSKIVWASAVAVDALQPFVDEVLSSIAEHTGQPGVKSAFISDESAVYDFLAREDTGRTEPHPFDKARTVKIVTTDIPANHEIVDKIAAELEVSVGLYDHIYEVAIRLRDR